MKPPIKHSEVARVEPFVVTSKQYSHSILILSSVNTEMNLQSEINRAVEAALIEERNKSRKTVKAEVEAAVETA